MDSARRFRTRPGRDIPLDVTPTYDTKLSFTRSTDRPTDLKFTLQRIDLESYLHAQSIA